MHPAIAVVGYKNSGKTTAAVELVQALTRAGRQVGAAKHMHGSMSAPNTDTDRLLQTGASVAGMAGDQTAVFWPERRFLKDVAPLLGGDVLVVEGGKDLGWLPRVLVLREESPERDAEELGRGLALATYGRVRVTGLPHCETPDELAALALERGFTLPGLDCGECGREDCAAMSRDIVAGKAGTEACQAMGGKIEVTINGQVLGMKSFVEDMVYATVRAMLGELKGYTPGDVTITLKAK